MTTLPKELYLSLNLSAKLQQSNQKVAPHLSPSLSVFGTVDVWIAVKDRRSFCKIYILDGQGLEAAPLLSRSDCTKLNLVKRLTVDAFTIAAPISLDDILSNFADVFEKGTAKLPFCYHPKLKENTLPIAEPVRRVPFGLKAKLKDVLDVMVARGDLEKIEEPTQWILPHVNVCKKR